MRALLFLLFLVPGLCLPLQAEEKTDASPKPASHTERNIEGWTVRVDDRLLSGENAARGTLAVQLLSARLLTITMVVREPALTRLRNVVIQIDQTHGALHNMQYHPNAAWLKENGYSESLVKCVHIPDAAYFCSPFQNHRQPWAVLHELAHAYHDQVLGFEEPRIKAAWIKFKDSGRYESVLTSQGGKQKHYALTNQKEFFAEMTEAYFGSNDFYPFVAGELQSAEPELFALLAEIWGPLPKWPDVK